MPAIDHTLILENIWVVISISVGFGAIIGEIAGFVHGNLSLGPKFVIGAGAALVIFGSIWFFAPAPTA
jgi:ABC-type glucose/galactose transport system permease subunit